MKRLILSILFLMVLAPLVLAQSPFEVWADIWGNGAYYSTNYESKTFNNPLLRSDGRFGFYLFPLWGEAYLKPYIVYTTVMSKDTAYHNNNTATGVGMRIHPFMGLGLSQPLEAIKVFYEILNEPKATSVSRPNQDIRYGLDYWLEINQPRFYDADKSVAQGEIWSEIWGNLSVRSTNLYENDFNGYLLMLETKTGIYSTDGKEFAGPEPYFKFDITKSSKNYYWLNRVLYGLGVRIEPFRFQKGFPPEVLYKLKVFLEYASVVYLDKKPDTDIPGNVRFGIDFTYGR